MPSLMSEKQRYAPVNSSEDASDGSSTASYTEGVWRRRFYMLLVSSVSIIVIVIAGAMYRIKTFSCPPPMPGVSTPYSPAPLTYYNKWLKGDPETPKFVGQPRPELDQAWHDLLQGTMIRFSDEELLHANNATSVRHRDGGYVGGLGISHSLHCIKRIKQYLHPEYYYADGEQDWEELYSHVDHCLESLRQEALCFADVNVFTLKWTGHSRVKPGISVPQPHACVNWEALHEWMKGREAGLQDLEGPPQSLYGWREHDHDHNTEKD